MLVPRLTRRRLLNWALAALFLWLGSSALVTWKSTRRSGAPVPERPPEVAWARIESLRLATCDGQELGAWLVRGDPHTGCAVLLHGYHGSRQQMLPVMQCLSKAHFTVLAITFRAHGDSTGELNDIGYSGQYDVVAAVEFLHKEFPHRPVYVVGRSMGAAAAIFAVRELGDKIAGYFLEQPYKDLDSAAWNRLQHYLPPGLDRVAYGGLRLWAPVFLPVDPMQISPYDRVVDIPETVPVVFITGSADRHAHLDEVTAIYNRIESHARLVVVSGAQHVDLDRAAPELYRRTLLDFLDKPRN